MSLVYEALQKAEREKERKAGTFAPPKPVSPKPAATVAATPAAPKPSSRNYVGVLIVCASLVAVGALAYVAVFMTGNTLQAPPAPVPTSAPTPVTKAAAPPPSPTVAATEANTPPPAPTAENDSRFKLTGIMATEGKFGAVINGRIVYDGYYVDGATVKKVERDRATLESNGREIVLRLF